MRAAVYFGRHDVRIIDFQEPPLTGTEVRVATSYCDLCGTGLHKYDGLGGSRSVIPPVVPGHEANGIVVEAGRNISGIHIGNRVCVDLNWGCGHCTYCQVGMPRMYENSCGVVKGFTEYICPSQENVYPLPDTLSLKHAALAELLSCCLYGMGLLDVHLGDHVLIVGMEAVGFMIVQLCRLAGAAQIVAIEPWSEKRELAETLGATMFLSPDNDVKGILQKQQLHINRVMECAGLKTTIENAFQYAGKCAMVVLFGLDDPQQPVAFNQYGAFQKELTIRTNSVNPHTTQRTINLLACGAIDYDAVIGRILGLEEIMEELQTRKQFRRDKVLVCIQPHTGAIVD